VPEEPRDRRFAAAPDAAPVPRSGPHFLLMSPRTPANCGLAARALKNFGFRSLSLVALPENGKDYFGDHARGAAWSAWDVLAAAETPGTLREARAKLRVLVAVDPDPPAEIPRLDLEEAAALALEDPDGTGFLFGRESSGLTRDELLWATHALVLPTAPDYVDLNVAQAVLLVAAEIRRARLRRGEPIAAAPSAPAATQEEIERLARRAAAWLRAIGYVQAGRPGWRRARGLLRMLLRARPRPHEIALLLGVVQDAERSSTRSAPRARAKPTRRTPPL
jgi:TrmH family RNA methyltransferase